MQEVRSLPLRWARAGSPPGVAQAVAPRGELCGPGVAVVPRANAPKKGSREIEGLTIHPVDRIEEAMEVVRSLQ